MLTKLEVKNNPKLLNEYIQEHKSDYADFKQSEISKIVKNDFTAVLHTSTIDKHIDPQYKNQAAVKKAKKAKHKTSLRSRIINRVKNATKEELLNIASGFDETVKLIDKKS